MLFKPKNILAFFISMFIAACLMPFFSKIININTALIYILTLIPSFLISIITAHTFPLIYKKVLKKELIYTEKREQTYSRQTGLDIIRCIAVFFVPLIHFFGLTGYYNTNLSNSYIFYFTFIRWIAVCAVPLFLIITGYFKINKTLSKKHYAAIPPVLASHIFIASVRLFTDFKYHNIKIDAQYVLDKLLYFEYGWYVRLYIGMLLLMPFLNLCYNRLKTKEHKQYLILTLIFLTSAGPLCFDIIPSSWLILYVFMYYFIGGYLREYKIKINRFLLIFLLLATAFITCAATHINSAGGVFDWDFLAYGSNSGYSSLPVVIISVLIFLIFMDINIKLKPLSIILKSISAVSLEMYLFSQMFDGIIYTPMQNFRMDFYFYSDKMPIIVSTVICLSFIAAKAKQLLFYVLSRIPYIIKAVYSKYIFNKTEKNSKAPSGSN